MATVIRVTSQDSTEDYRPDWKGWQGSFAAVILNSKKVTVEKDIGTFVYEAVEVE